MDTTAEKIAPVIAVAPATQMSLWALVVYMESSFRLVAPVRMRGDWGELSTSRARPVLKEDESPLKRSGLVLNRNLKMSLRCQGHHKCAVRFHTRPAQAAKAAAPLVALVGTSRRQA